MVTACCLAFLLGCLVGSEDDFAIIHAEFVRETNLYELGGRLEFCRRVYYGYLDAFVNADEEVRAEVVDKISVVEYMIGNLRDVPGQDIRFPVLHLVGSLKRAKQFT